MRAIATETRRGAALHHVAADILTAPSSLSDTTAMLNAFALLFAAFDLAFRRNHALAILCVAMLLSACSVTDAPSVVPMIAIPQERVHALCWEPPNVNNGPDADKPYDYIVMVDENEAPVSNNQQPAFNWAVADGALIYKYDVNAPVQNLRLLPLRYSEAWCTRVPKPTNKDILRLLDPCTTAALMPDGRAAAKNLMGQAEDPSIHSPFFCGKLPRLAPTAQETILIRARNEAFQEAYDYAHKTAMALTQAEAEVQAVINNSDSWLKQALTSNPGTIEQIQQRLANQLNSIEAPPDYGDTILDGLALAGMNAGFDNGKFEVEAKLFAIDAGVMLIEFAAMEVALGPLGGAKLIASAVSKGSKGVAVVAGKGSQLLNVATTKGGQALIAAMKRLENIPIFIPGAANGVGGAVRIGAITRPISARMHRYWLEKAMKAAPFNRLREIGEALHHIVAHGDERAEKARKILDTFKVNIDEAFNGVFLPATSKSPNPKGAIVHSMVHSTDYYKKVDRILRGAKSRKDVIRRLQRIREMLENGTFFDATP